jgi:hypothetical protein
MEGKGRYIIIGAIAIVAVMISFMAGKSYGAREGVIQCQVEAIKAGHAKYVISDELGHTEFHWMEKGDVELPKADPKAEAKKP